MIALREYFCAMRGKTVLTIPFRLSFFLGYTNNSNRYVTLFANIGKRDSGKSYRWLMRDRYPFVRSELDDVIKRFDIDCVVVNKSDISTIDRQFKREYYNFSRFNKIYDNDNFSVYAVDR
jgi:hypothetical protein